jgi:spore maturation protein CgeB
LDNFFVPQQEILLPTCGEDVARYITDYSDQELRAIGRRAQQRVLAEHTSECRAQQFEAWVEQAKSLRERQSEVEFPTALTG